MILVQKLSVQFGGEYLFKEISFRVNKGNRIGLAGKNGAGKSTLLKILAKKNEPSKGEVVHEGDISVGYLSQDLKESAQNTVFEETEKAFVELKNLEGQIEKINQQLTERTDYESDDYAKLIEDVSSLTERFSILGGYTMASDIERILLGLGFTKEDFNRSTTEFSGGWRMRIELAKLLLQKHDVMLLDEPTNHLDIDSILWFEEFLQGYTGAVILVSHDKLFLDNITNRTIEISNKKIEDYKANYSKFIELRTERREKLFQSQKNQEKEIKHTEELIAKFRAKANKASMAQSLMKKLDKIERIEIDNEDVTRMNIRFVSAVTPGKIIYTLEDVGKKYGEKTIFSGTDMLIERGAKVAFVGQNGQGKSTLAKIMVGETDATAGKVEKGHNVEVGYFAQNQAEVLDPNKTVEQEAEYAATVETNRLVRDYLGAFMFSGEAVEKKTSVLSGGERNRLALCKLLLKPFNVLVMDEPTNHLDIQSKEILKQALKKFEGTLILVSHDREFLDGLVDKVFEFKSGKVKEHLGGIADYLESRKVQDFRQIEASTETPVKAKVTEKSKGKSFEETKEDKRLKNKIAKVEAEITELEAKIKTMEAGFVTENPSEEKLSEYKSLQESLEKVMEEWEVLAG